MKMITETYYDKESDSIKHHTLAPDDGFRKVAGKDYEVFEGLEDEDDGSELIEKLHNDNIILTARLQALGDELMEIRTFIFNQYGAGWDYSNFMFHFEKDFARHKANLGIQTTLGSH